MSDFSIREPIQKRSIEKKTKIIKAGIGLFSEKGFYKTNTVEIAKAAGVSTGTVYSYFKDKKDIYIACFEYFLDGSLRPLLDELENLPKPVETKVLVDKFLDLFIHLYVHSKQTISELGLMQQLSPEIMQHFAAYEDMIFSALVKAFEHPGAAQNNATEKIYLLYTLADILGQEHAFHYHKNIDLEVLRRQIAAMITHLFADEPHG